MKTANDCIRNAEAAIANFAGQLSEEALRDIAAVVAMARFQKPQSVMLSCYRTGRRPSERLLDEYREAADVVDSALCSCGVEVNS